MSNAMTQFEALRARMDTFLVRLEQRVDETLAEAVPAAREMAAGGKDAVNSPEYTEFVGGLTSQIKALGTRAQRTFAEQFAIFDDHDDEDVSDAYESLELRVEAWAEDIGEKAETAFAEVTAAAGGGTGSAYQQAWDAAVADWKEQAHRFRCPQCSAPVPLPEFELCGESQYVACTGCGTQTTYLPTDTIVYGLQIGEHLAEERTAAFEKIYDRLMDDPKAERPRAVVAEAQWRAAEQLVLESLKPRAAAARLDSVRSALDEWDATYGRDAEGAGSYQVEVSYYRCLMGLANTIAHYRGEGREREAQIISEMVPAFGRPGCEVAGAIAAGTYTEALGQSYLERAQTCEVAYDWDGKAWDFA